MTGPEYRFTITVTPMSEADLQVVVDAVRARFGRKHLIHIIGKQPHGTSLHDAPTTTVDSLQAQVTRLTGRLKFEIEQTQENHRAFRYLADKVIEWFNPPDGDESEEWICAEAVMAAGKYIEAQPCTCEDGAGYPDYLVDPCARCQVLGRAADKEIER